MVYLSALDQSRQQNVCTIYPSHQVVGGGWCTGPDYIVALHRVRYWPYELTLRAPSLDSSTCVVDTFMVRLRKAQS
jgi:hypothetical protein